MFPQSRSIPFLVGAGVGIFVALWGASGVGKGSSDERQFLAGLAGLGAAIACAATAMLVISLENTLRQDWMSIDSLIHSKWIKENIADGRLSFYTAAILFGSRLFWQGARMSLPAAGAWQNAIFGVGLLTLAYAYARNESFPLLGVLSWSVFFVFGDWGLIEEFVIKQNARLPAMAFLRIVVVDVVILVSLGVVQYHLWSGYIASQLVVLVVLSLSLLLLFLASVVGLYAATHRGL